MLKSFRNVWLARGAVIGVGLISSMGGRGEKTVAGYRSVYLFVSLESVRTSHCHLWEHQFFCVMIIFSHTPFSRTSRYLLFAGNEDFRYFYLLRSLWCLPVERFDSWLFFLCVWERDLVLFIVPVKPNPKHTLAKKFFFSRSRCCYLYKI